ncbi:dihydrolipoyl dehydrogenase [Alkalilimnicola sp. S0819]|uniref:dihydrolipoyl dehydrogenase n=1 Tax=Alkalilimnicola sp. S0819 TaxID=2613922 RepID=UPI001261A5DC|nr:dihydrolipoyl dehydrogenase [Alkalilimnicola sp. S0819]KAB7627231.1 dihydrolipoyl dehydrogenase [Alkalilimnicola sp. S0819]MPQ15944.1 dihydrolipoyl dehydrogenase [Alkalilimnicola sp. S0819]
MADTIELKVPDIGDFDAVDVIEVLIAAGDRVEQEQSLLTLESDKATMEVPAERAGTITEVRIKVGDQVAQGDVVALLQPEESEGDAEEGKAAQAEAPAEKAAPDNAHAPAQTAEKGGDQPAPAPAPSDAPDEVDADVVVLGAGPGGYTAAFRAADLGLKVILIEKHASLGGVCLNVGCIPSKALLHAAKVIEEAAEFAEHGVSFGKPKLDLKKLGGWRDQVIGKLTAGLKGLAKQRKVEVVQGEARFTDPHTFEVTAKGRKSRRIRFRHCILAAGSRPVAPPGMDLDHPLIMDSTDALQLEDVPKRLLVIGGGIIGLEMATVYQALGARVTVVELADRLIPGVDADMVKPLRKRIEPRYEAIYLGTRVTALEPGKKQVKVRFEGKDAPDEDSFERVLVAVGRRPNSDRLNVEAAGLKLDEHGHIPVDEFQRSNVAHIHVIGDLAGQPMLAHKATHEGKVAAEVIAGHKSAFEPRCIPSVAYTDPEVAWAGLTEEQAKARGIAVDKAVFPWAANGRALSLNADSGMTKLLFSQETGRLLGGAITGPNAGDLISEVVLAIEMGAEAEDIALSIHPHPTLSETVAMAAEAAAGTLTDLYLPKR